MEVCVSCRGGECTTLNVGRCDGCNRACVFYKSRPQLQEELRRCYARLRALPREQQDALSDKYLKGVKPYWEEEDAETETLSAGVHPGH